MDTGDRALRRGGRIAGHILPPLLLLVLMIGLHPFRTVFSFDPDEGNNLIKARLVHDGHALYGEIWSDQPPLFTHLLRWWLELTGWTVEGGRMLVLLCASVLVWSLYQLTRRTAGHLGASTACVLLVLSFAFLRLSASVMLAVPSLMFAMLAMQAALKGADDARGGWPALSGVCLALSMAVKLWTVVLIPVMAVAVIVAARRAPFLVGVNPVRRAASAWAVGLLATLIVTLVPLVPLDQLNQLVAPHLGVERPGGSGAAAFWLHFVDDLAVVLLAVVGTAGAVRRRDGLGLVPAAWAASAAIALCLHEPVWYHHYLLVSVALCWAAGQAVPELMRTPWLDSLRRWRGPATVHAWATGTVVFVALVLATRMVPVVIQRDFTSWRRLDDSRDRALVESLSARAAQTHWMFTDRQIVAFRAGLAVPPPLAVTSLKRQWGGNLDDVTLLGLLREYDPEQVYLSGRRVPMTGPLRNFLARGYQQTIAGERGSGLFVRKDLESGEPAPTVTAGAE